jgi:sialate O-acetylesterase
MKLLSTYLVFSVLLTAGSQAEDWKMILELRGTWKIELGDDKRWADPKFDDRKWQSIFVPSPWENEGFPGYDGFAWYRQWFTLPQHDEKKTVYLHLGCVDDVSEVYVNGHFLGGYGSLPPHFQTAYNQEEIFGIPDKFWNHKGQNLIAVRVYDDGLDGGIVSGRIGLYEQTQKNNCDIPFADMWKFKVGDNAAWKAPKFDDSQWQELNVPAHWDNQGYGDYDGFGWYRVKFYVPKELSDESMVLLLGKIDDVDQAFINGVEVGHTGIFWKDGSVGKIGEEYKERRAYALQKSVLKYGEMNVLAVRVYDYYRYGGICEGPVGIVTRSTFRHMYRNSYSSPGDSRGTLEKILDEIFHDN